MKDEYDFKESKQNSYAKKFDDIVESSWLNSLAKLIKKFKSSKSYWSVSYIVILFILREAGALVYGTILKEYVQKHLEGSDYTWLWSAIEFVFGFGGSVELVILGLFFFVVLSLVKISEGENNAISLKENFLSLLLSFAIVGMSIYMIRNNDINHTETHKQQQITNTKLDEIKALIKLQGGDETVFLEKYFGKDYAVILGHPKTYHNFTTLLKQTNKSADELLKERVELLKKIASQSFNPNLQKQIDKAFRELRYDDARELIDGFLEANSEKEKEIIKAHYLKALSYMEQFRYDEAKDEFEKIAPNIGDARILSDYAKIYDLVGEYNISLDYSMKALKIRIFNSLFSQENPSIAVNYYNMASVFYNKGEYLKALRYYRKSLKVIQETLGNTHPNIAYIYMNIGVVLNANGEYDEAMVYEQQSLEIFLNSSDNNNVNIAISYSKIGEVWTNKGNYNKALEYQKKALKIILKNLDEQDPLIGKIYNNIGMAWSDKGDYKKALEHITKSLNIMYKILGKNNSTIGAIYHNLGTVWAKKGKYDKAIDYHQKSLKILLPTLGKTHPTIAEIYDNIGMRWYSKGKYEKAIDFYEKSLKIRLATLGKNHPSIALSYNHIGSYWSRKGKYNTAIKYYTNALMIWRKVFPDGHPNIDTEVNNIKSVKKSLKNEK